jgi:hypothetical protein
MLRRMHHAQALADRLDDWRVIPYGADPPDTNLLACGGRGRPASPQCSGNRDKEEIQYRSSQGAATPFRDKRTR